MLQQVARELSRMRVLIVANYRDTDITRQSSLSETLAALNRETGFDRIVLRGLTRDEVASYVSAKAKWGSPSSGWQRSVSGKSPRFSGSPAPFTSLHLC